MTQIRYPLLCIRMRRYFREYSRCSSIHGFRYFGEDRTHFERVWWFVVFNIVVAGCVHSINLVYQKWNDSPVIVSFDTRETKLDSIPFPAVTICPETKSVTSKFNYIYVMLKLTRGEGDVNVTDTEKRYAEYMNMNCDLKFNLSEKSSTLPADDFSNFLDDVRPKTIFLTCMWMKMPTKCEQLFTPIITDEGICYTFNMLDRNLLFKENVAQFKDFMVNPLKKNSSWNVEDGYVDAPVSYHKGISSDSNEDYPWRALFAGAKNAFEVTLVTYRDDLNPVCKNGIHGFKVMLHAPMRFPLVGDQYFRVPLDEAVLGALQPVKMTTSENVAKYELGKRQCYITRKDPNPLKYFKVYSQLNCNLDCLTTFTLKTCGCVNFYMPRTNRTKICGTKRAACMKWAEQYITRKKKVKSDKKTGTPKGFSCNCLPICSDLSYHIETTQAKWDWPETLKILNPNSKKFKKSKISLSKLTLYFKASQFVTSKRHELYGFTDFIANFGGLLGLFTGVSVLSIMEVIYFVTLRLFFNIRLYGRWFGLEPEQQ